MPHEPQLAFRNNIALFPSTITSGMLSEEPSESCNKDLKKWQIEHAIQSDPVRRNLDVFNRLLDRSDPVVHSHLESKKMHKKFYPYPQEVLNLCKNPEEILELQNSTKTL